MALCLAFLGLARARAADRPALEVGIATRDITPELPIRLAGYAGRKQPADRIDQPLAVQALAFKNSSGERFVLVALDNCEVSHAFMEPVLQALDARFHLTRGAVAVVSSHTHSAPVLEDTLTDMVQPTPAEREQIAKYSSRLRARLVDVVGAALADCRPATMEYGAGRCTFAMNRRLYQGDKVLLADNPDGPVDWDVPVLRVKGTNDAVRAVVFGYACHGTDVRSGDDWYAVSGEYMAYARQQIEQHEPGATAMYVTGMGADSDPSPRGQLLHARRHGLELAGAVIGVLDRPMRNVSGPFRSAYDEVDLPLAPPPDRQRLEQDAQNQDIYIQQRAQKYLRLLDAGKPLPGSVKLPVAVLRFAADLTFVFAGGEVVVDYSRRLKRTLAADHPWTVGYAYEVPCYIPTTRLIKEGGYEADYSLIYYGYYGPFRAGIEGLLAGRLETMVGGLRSSN